jgi:D-aminopeptidase
MHVLIAVDIEGIARVPGTELLPGNSVRYATGEYLQLFNMLITWRTILKADQVPS